MKADENKGVAGKSRARSTLVRSRLIDVAERLFAEHGIDSVSFNQIARAANQRNSTVIQYHFGSKTGLLQAIAERRMQAVNERRLELLSRVDGSDRLADLERVAEAMVLPFAEHLSHEGGSYFVRFVAHLYSDPRMEMFELIKGKHDSGMHEAGRLAREIMAEMPGEAVRHRLAVVTTMIFFAFADREKLRAAGKHIGVARLHTAHFVNDLIAMIVGALNAPYGERKPTDKDVSSPSTNQASTLVTTGDSHKVTDSVD
ncbi:MAG: TetR/AcrR family transcriptional regulator [Burkholderiales bacterium]|nr:TetR/AcrR family transcriptional regulator [Burkholderiales bacterium]